jgi:TRAP-type uncharacterized transport system fused permease subunit
MTGSPPPRGGVEATRLAAADRFVEEEEGATHRLRGRSAVLLKAALALTSVLHLYAAFDVVSAPCLRGTHVALMLGLLFLTLPAGRAWRDRIMFWDWPLALASLACIAYLLHDWDACWQTTRSADPQASLRESVIALSTKRADVDAQFIERGFCRWAC